MGYNIKKALSYMKKDIEKNFGMLDFDYEVKADSVECTAELTLDNHEGTIMVILTAYAGEVAEFRFVFDKIVRTYETLELVNDFNEVHPFFNAFIREDGYLELKHFFVCYGDDVFKNYASETLIRMAKLADDEMLQKLTRLTTK